MKNFDLYNVCWAKCWFSKCWLRKCRLVECRLNTHCRFIFLPRFIFFGKTGLFLLEMPDEWILKVGLFFKKHRFIFSQNTVYFSKNADEFFKKHGLFFKKLGWVFQKTRMSFSKSSVYFFVKCRFIFLWNVGWENAGLFFCDMPVGEL